MVDAFGRTPAEAARDGLLLMIGIQQKNGFLAPEIAEQAREFVRILSDGSDHQRALERRDAFGDGWESGRSAR